MNLRPGFCISFAKTLQSRKIEISKMFSLKEIIYGNRQTFHLGLIKLATAGKSTHQNEHVYFKNVRTAKHTFLGKIGLECLTEISNC